MKRNMKKLDCEIKGVSFNAAKCRDTAATWRGKEPSYLSFLNDVSKTQSFSFSLMSMRRRRRISNALLENQEESWELSEILPIPKHNFKKRLRHSEIFDSLNFSTQREHSRS